MIETGDVEKLKKEVTNSIPPVVWGVPSDISRACLYLSDPSNTFVTGPTSLLIGGMTRKMIYED